MDNKHFKIISKEKFKVLVIPDIHLKDYNPKNRYNFPEEIMNYLKRVDELITDKNIDLVVFLGDIFDRTFVKPKSAKFLLDYMKVFQSMKDKAELITLMGNHERNNITEDNPFFRLTEITSIPVKEDIQYYPYINKVVVPMFKCMDYIKVNSTLLYFNNYTKNKYDIILPVLEGVKHTLAFYHDTLDSPDIRQYLQYNFGIDLLDKMGGHYVTGEEIIRFNHVFFGHNHIPVKTFKIGNTTVDNIGALGRNSSLESYESINLPIITINEDSYKVDYEFFPLLPFYDSFKKNILEINTQERINKAKLKQTLTTLDKNYDLEEVFEEFENCTLHSEIRKQIVGDKSTYVSTMLESFMLIKTGQLRDSLIKERRRTDD